MLTLWVMKNASDALQVLIIAERVQQSVTHAVQGPSNHRKGRHIATNVQPGDTVPIMPQLIHVTAGLLRVQLERSAPWRENTPGPPVFSALQVSPLIICRQLLFLF